MTAHIGAVAERPAITIRRVLPVAVAGFLLPWIAVVAGRGAVLALQAIGVPVAGEPQTNYATTRMIWAAALVYLSCLVAALICRRLRPSATLPITFAMGGIVVLAGAAGTGSLGSLGIVLALAALAWLLGNAALHLLPSLPQAPVVRLPIAMGLGLGLLGLLLFLMAALKVLNAATVIGGAGAILGALLVLDRKRLAADFAQPRGWRPATPSWFETAIIGCTVGLVAFALLMAFVPETMSDAIRQHLPVAREIWQSGSVADFPLLGASRGPMQAHLLYAAGYGLGGVPAAKLIQVLAGLSAIAGIAGIGWLCAGRVAAVVGAAVYATIPLELWLIGHIYADQFAVLFTVTATLCILIWQRDTALGWLVGAGALAGFGLAVKLNMGLLIIALATAIFLVGRRPWHVRDRVQAVIAFGLGTVVVVPWLARGYFITGSLPGVQTLREQASKIVPALQTPVASVATAATGGDLPVAGIARSPLDLLLSPWHLTFAGGPNHYLVIRAGEFGIALLMLLPLLLLAPRNRALAFLAVTTIVSFVGWWFSIQVPRHLLATLAIAAAMTGIGVASVVAAGRSRPRPALAAAAQLGMIAGLLVVPLFFLPNQTTRLPLDLITGRESAAEYVEDSIRSTVVLAAASAELPPDTRVGYIGLWEGPQFYTEARLLMLGTYSVDPRYLLDNQLGSTPEKILSRLDELGLDYFIWDRVSTRTEDWRSTLLSTRFLREHTRILAGDGDSYLFALRPRAGRGWGEERLRNLLDDPDLSSVGKDGPWMADGRFKAKRGLVKLRPNEAIAQRVSVSGGQPYLLTATAMCVNETDPAVLTLRWVDDRGVELGAASEAVIPGLARSEQFLWRRAPHNAASVSAELSSSPHGSGCEFDEAALYALS